MCLLLGVFCLLGADLLLVSDDALLGLVLCHVCVVVALLWLLFVCFICEMLFKLF